MALLTATAAATAFWWCATVDFRKSDRLLGLIKTGNCGPGNGNVRCAILNRACPLWVSSGGHDRDSPAAHVRFAPESGQTV
jgi:hypothetical protein